MPGQRVGMCRYGYHASNGRRYRHSCSVCCRSARREWLRPQNSVSQHVTRTMVGWSQVALTRLRRTCHHTRVRRHERRNKSLENNTNSHAIVIATGNEWQSRIAQHAKRQQVGSRQYHASCSRQKAGSVVSSPPVNNEQPPASYITNMNTKNGAKNTLWSGQHEQVTTARHHGSVRYRSPAVVNRRSHRTKNHQNNQPWSRQANR